LILANGELSFSFYRPMKSRRLSRPRWLAK